MKRTDIMRRASRNLTQAKGRTFLTSLAIAVGAFTLTMSLAAGEGARRYADDLLKNNVDPQALFIVKDDEVTNAGPRSDMREYSEADAVGSLAAGSSIKLMTDDDVKKLKSVDSIEQVVPIYQLTPKYARFQGNDTRWTVPVDYYDATIKNESIAGEMPDLGKQIKNNQVVVPEEFATQLGVSPDTLIGQKVSITFARTPQAMSDEQLQQVMASGGQEAVANLLKAEEKTFEYTIVAVKKKPAMALTNSPRLQISTGASQKVTEFVNNGNKSVGFVGVTAVAKNNPEETKELLQKEYGYSVQTAEDAQGMLFTFVNVLQGIVAGFAMLALIASVFGIINTQYISVLERTSQIGLMKALGMPRSGVAKLFRYEAAWIGFLGGVLGAAVAVAVGLAMNPWISEKLSLGEHRLLIFVWWHILILITSLVIVAIVAGWLPARKAAKLDPIEALRTE